MAATMRIEDGYAVVDSAATAGSFGELATALDELRDRPGIHAAVLDLGHDLAEGFLESEAAVLGRCVLPLVAAWGGTVKPAALAAGLWCDVRVTAPDTAFVAVDGLHAPTVERLVEIVSPDRDPELAAIDLRTLGSLLGGAAAADVPAALLEAGLVTDVAEPGGALHAAEQLARMIASRGPLATQLAKEAVWRGLRMPFEQALRFETDLTLLLQTTNDRAEGVRAFLEKRPPRFTGA
jgi:enoyl-CoA hydratase/carnithine racemase